MKIWLVSLLVLTLAACDHSDTQFASTSASGSSQAKKVARIALVLKTQTNPFFVEMENGARRAEKEMGIQLVVKSSSQETHIEEQIQLVQELIDAKIDALVIAPGDSLRLVPVIKKAQDAGIPVVNIDNALDKNLMESLHMHPIPFVSVDNEVASYQVVKMVADKVVKPTKAAILEGLPGANNGILRMQGAVRAFHQQPLINVVAQKTANWKIDDGHDATKALFAKYPDIGILFCANDMMALGAVQYLMESGRKKVIVIGFDAIEEAKLAIKDGTMAASVDQQAAEQGYQGVALAVRAIKGEQLPPIVMVDTRVVSQETVK